MVRQRLRSKTYLLSLLVTALGVVQANFPHIKELLGEHAGVTFMVIGVLIAVLRELTKEPVAAK